MGAKRLPWVKSPTDRLLMLLLHVIVGIPFASNTHSALEFPSALGLLGISACTTQLFHLQLAAAAAQSRILVDKKERPVKWTRGGKHRIQQNE
jgi:hypothetical protein